MTLQKCKTHAVLKLIFIIHGPCFFKILLISID